MPDEFPQEIFAYRYCHLPISNANDRLIVFFYRLLHIYESIPSSKEKKLVQLCVPWTTYRRMQMETPQLFLIARLTWIAPNVDWVRARSATINFSNRMFTVRGLCDCGIRRKTRIVIKISCAAPACNCRPGNACLNNKNYSDHRMRLAFALCVLRWGNEDGTTFDSWGIIETSRVALLKRRNYNEIGENEGKDERSCRGQNSLRNVHDDYEICKFRKGPIVPRLPPSRIWMQMLI